MREVDYINLKPLNWSQTIRHRENLKAESDDGRFLTATCTVDDDCTIRLGNNTKLRDYQFPLSVLKGGLTANKRQRAGLDTEAIGGLWFLEDQDYVHGWIHLASPDYEHLWDQVRKSDYMYCSIRIEVASAEDQNKFTRLSIRSADISFGRGAAADQKPTRKGLFGFLRW
jgi:hypothetical protein